MSPSPAELHTFLHSRRSVRFFAVEPVADEIVERVIESATWAPNSHNRQPWFFVRLQSQPAREKLVAALTPHYIEALQEEGMSAEEAEGKASVKNRKIMEAPEAILLCLDQSRMDHYQDHHRDAGELVIAQQSVALAGGQMLLAAHAEGLGSVWVCAPLFVPEKIQTALDLGANIIPQAVLLMGHMKEEPRPKTRRPLSEVLLKR